MGCGGELATLAELEDELNESGPVASGNKRLWSGCAEPDCISCSSFDDCASDLFESDWNAPGVEYGSFDAAGWLLDAMTPCGIATGGFGLGAEVPTDFEGDVRDPSEPSIGAFEQEPGTNCTN
jgi:hypothetical protein